MYDLLNFTTMKILSSFLTESQKKDETKEIANGQREMVKKGKKENKWKQTDV